MIRNGGETKLDVGDRYSIMSGDRLRFGALSCRVEYSQQVSFYLCIVSRAVEQLIFLFSIVNRFRV